MRGFSKMGLYFAEENTSFKYIWLRLLDSPRVTRHFHCMDDNDQQQQDEICALEAIYAENFEL